MNMDITEIKSKIVDKCTDIAGETYTLKTIDFSIHYMLRNDCSLIHYIRAHHVFDQLYQIVRTKIEFERQLAKKRLLKVRVLDQWLNDYDIIKNIILNYINE